MYLNVDTCKNNSHSVCPKWKIYYFQVAQMENPSYPGGPNGKLFILGVPKFQVSQMKMS